MKKDIIIYALAAACLLIILPVEAAQSRDLGPIFENWQLERLFNPGAQQLAQEKKGMIFIYDGLKSSDIDQVMNSQFDRIDNMMFTRTIITNEKGEPKRHRKTGQMMIEDDGC